MLGEDVEDEGRAVKYFDVLAEDGFQFALMAGREFIVEDDHVGLTFADEELDLLGLARADEGGRVGLVKTLDGLADHVDAGRIGQARQLLQAIFNQ